MGMYTPPLKAALCRILKKSAVDLFKQRRHLVFSKARCAVSFARYSTYVRARREPLDDEVNPGHGVYRPPPRYEVLRLKLPISNI